MGLCGCVYGDCEGVYWLIQMYVYMVWWLDRMGCVKRV